MKSQKSRQLIIVGAGKIAEVAYEYFVHDSLYDVVAFSVENEYKASSTLFGLPVVSFEELENIYSPKDYDVFVAVGFTQVNRLRMRFYYAAKEKGYSMASYISSHAFVWHNAIIGEHCFIPQYNNIQPFVTIGDNVFLWTANHIGHHVKIEDHCFISGAVGISGHSVIKQRVFLGANTMIADGVTVDSDCWVTPGAVITSNTKSGEIYRGPVSRPSGVSVYQFFDIKDSEFQT